MELIQPGKMGLLGRLCFNQGLSDKNQPQEDLSNSMLGLGITDARVRWLIWAVVLEWQGMA